MADIATPPRTTVLVASIPPLEVACKSVTSWAGAPVIWFRPEAAATIGTAATCAAVLTTVGTIWNFKIEEV